MQELRDIRTLEEIPDVSFYLFVIMIVVGVLLVVGIAIMIGRHFRKRHGDLTRQEVLKRLENITFDNPKDAAYKITKYGRYLAKEERSQKLFVQLEKKLLKYKFTPTPPAFDDDTIGEFHLFLESLDG